MLYFVVQVGWTAHVVLLADSIPLDFCDSANRYQVVLFGLLFYMFVLDF